MADANLVVFAGISVPTLVTSVGEHAGVRFMEFFVSTIRNSRKRHAYERAAGDFPAWCASAGVRSIAAVQPPHLAA